MYKAFKDRGYPSSLIRKAQKLVPFSYRPIALKNKSKTQNKYDTFLIHKILNNNFQILMKKNMYQLLVLI